MLVLTRAIGESFRIGDDVEILVADTNGVAVKLGIEAPKCVPVHRKEIYECIFPIPSPLAKQSYPSKLMPNSR